MNGLECLMREICSEVMSQKVDNQVTFHIAFHVVDCNEYHIISRYNRKIERSL